MTTSRLPRLLTSMVGRQAEIEEVRAALGRARLVTLVGAGGSGKTRLALEVGRELEKEHPIWFIDLARLREPALVGKAVIAVLGGREESGQPAAETIVALLKDHAAVFILDNCEHLVEAVAELVLNLLEFTSELRLLATSREPLGVAGEVRWPVPVLGEQDASELFITRAQLVVPSFAPTSQQLRTVDDICRRLDRLPLAIELAAARIGQLPIDEIRERLDGRLSLLTVAARTVPLRHQTIGATIDWSYQLLDRKDRELFAQLSVFAGGFDVPSAEQVAHAHVDSLGRLVDKSLLVAGQGVGGRARFRMLETLREYATERIVETGDAETAGRRHFEHFARIAAEAAPQLHGANQIYWLDRLDQEHDNLRAALDWGLDKDPHTATEMAASLAWFWNVRGHFDEAAERLKVLLAIALDAEARVRAKGLAALGRLALNLADKSESGPALDEAIVLWRRIGDGEGLAHALLSRGILGVSVHDPKQATEKWLLEALQEARAAGNAHIEAQALGWLGRTTHYWGEREEAQRRLVEAISLARKTGDVYTLAFALSALAVDAVESGDMEQSGLNLIEALELWEELRDPHWLARTQTYLGVVALELGNLVEAGNRFRAALTQPVTVWEKEAVEGMAALAAKRGNYDRAAQLHGASTVMPWVGQRRIKSLENEPWYSGALRTLGDGRLLSSWESGRLMTSRQAVECALSDEAGTTQARGPLSRREREVAELVTRGLTNREIAERLFISERTVDGHLEHIRDKLGVHSRSEIAVWVTKNK